jgi:teichoic acid transport system permease protein
LSAPHAASTPGEYSHVEYVFEPHSSSVPDVRGYLRALWDRRQFIAALADSDLRSTRARTTLGQMWAVLDPLFQASIYFFLYAVLRGGSAKQMQFLPVLIGDFFLFALTMTALTEGGASIKRAKSLMLNSTFPRALLPLTVVYKSLKRFLPAIVVFAILFPATGGRVGSGVLVLPLLFVVHVVMNVGIALLAATWVTLVADASNMMTYVGRILFFATPVVYPVALLSTKLQLALGWQPLFPVFASYQNIFTGGVPKPFFIFEAMVWAVVLLAVGSWVFLRHEREFAMHL